MSQSTVGVDFTLETVQYKFATIIGELCGKPSVLSQFAVWLDMRLAEYKLKGSISLDCSGLKPDPDWLQGLKDSIRPKTTHTPTKDRLTSDHQARSRLTRERPSSHHTPLHRRTVNDSDQRSPEIMVIKEEPDNDNHQDSVFPVGFHENDSSARAERKRHADNSSSIGDSSHVLSAVKSPRLSSTLTTSSHEGLTDASTLSSQDQSMSHIDDSELEQFIHDSNSSYSRGHNSAGYMDQGGNNSAEFFSGTVLMDNSMSSESTQPLDAQSLHIDDQQRTASSSDAGFPCIMDQGSSHYGQQSATKPDSHRQSDISVRCTEAWHSLQREAVHPPALSHKTRQNIAGAVASFWRWSSQAQVVRDRELYQIPPEELDGYLAEFFQNAKKPNGDEYNARTLISIRTHLSRYLRDNNYQECIAQSPKFLKSQQALKFRYKLSVPYLT